MATNLVVQAKSALSEEVKAATLSEEIVRRLRNTSQELDNSERLEILERACVKMKSSGHTEKFIRTAVAKGIKKFKGDVRRSELPEDNKGYSPLYKNASWRKDIRARNKLMKRKSWYSDNKDQHENFENTNHDTQGMIKKRNTFKKAGKGDAERIRTTTVVFVPSTRNGILVRKLREREEVMSKISGFRIRYQEAGGSKLSNQFSTDLGKGLHCGRVCHPCEVNGEKRENCRSKNLTYESSCTKCNPSSHQEEHDPTGRQKPRQGIYIGETSRSIHERAMEHVGEAEDFSVKSHIIKHWRLTHPDDLDMPVIKFRITGMFRDALSRQVREAMSIFYSKDELLNSKSEYVNNCISRVSVPESDWERKERFRNEEEEELREREAVNTFKEDILRRRRERDMAAEDPEDHAEENPETKNESMNNLFSIFNKRSKNTKNISDTISVTEVIRKVVTKEDKLNLDALPMPNNKGGIISRTGTEDSPAKRGKFILTSSLGFLEESGCDGHYSTLLRQSNRRYNRK